MNKFDFKEDLRRALKEKRFSQIELAHKSGISQSVISKFLLEDTDIRLSTFISLWFCLYNSPFPFKPDLWPPTASPTSESEQSEVQDA